jgi:hypothetical protein
VQNLIVSEPIEPSLFLIEALKRFVPLATAINTEKARSEYIIGSNVNPAPKTMQLY